MPKKKRDSNGKEPAKSRKPRVASPEIEQVDSDNDYIKITSKN
jgi:hypothetical protein